MKKDKSAKKAKADATEGQPEAERNADDYLISLGKLNELKSVQERIKVIGDFLSSLTIDDFQLKGVERFPMEFGIMLQRESGYMESILEDVEKDAAKA